MNTLLSSEILIVTCVFAASGSLKANAPDDCGWQEPSPQSQGSRESACGNGIVVQIGHSGGILISKDGSIWVEQQLGIRTFLRSVTFGQGLFVAVGGSYIDVPGAIPTSRDGVTWLRRNAANRMNLHQVACGDGLFVATGDSGTILTSTDGIKWKAQRSGTSASLAGVAYGNGLFVTGGEDGTLLTSREGFYWTSQRWNVSACLARITYRNGVFWAAGHGAILSSTDGITWHATNIALVVDHSETNSVMRSK
jgi:hypothetical protein